MKTTFTITPDIFVNDVALYKVGVSDYIRFYSLNESFSVTQGSVDVNRVLCEYITVDENGNASGYTLPNIVGLSNSVFGITSESLELQGKVLTIDNIADCVMEYYNA